VIETVKLIIRHPDQPERILRLEEGVSRLGRADDNEVVLPDIGVSRRHARIVVEDGEVRVDDLGSGNGTFYRGFRIQSQQLVDGDELIVDPFVLLFRVRATADRAGDHEVTQLERQQMARLDVVSGAGLHRTSYPLGSRGLTIGRSETRDVVIPDPAASRHHCSVLPRDGGYIARDMGSANGIFVNGVRVREALLSSGDVLRIGNTELRYTLVGVSIRDTAERPAIAPPQLAELEASELSLPLPERTRTDGGSSSTLRRLAAVGASVAVLAAALFVTVLAGTTVAWLIYARTRPISVALTQDARPPAWQLDLPAGLQPASVEDLDRKGAAAIESADHRAALQHLYRSLDRMPGRVSTERLAVTAGENLVLDQLEPLLDERHAARVELETRRTRLLQDADSRIAGRRNRATAALSEEFAEDLVVREAMRWGPGPLGQAQAERLTEGARLAGDGQWAQASAVYLEVYDAAADPVLRTNARAGQSTAFRRLVRDTHELWAATMLADATAEPTEVLQTTGALLDAWPDDPSAAALRARYGISP
jgi:pSer/pThr/pTyr-binding forkhead associated (FHA) protein